MSVDLKPYPAMKDSGVPWLGAVPEHWEVRRLGTSVHGCINGIWGNDPNGREDLPCVRVADFDRARLRVRLAKPTLRAVAPGERKRRLLKKSDLLLEKSGGGDLQPVGVVMLYDHDIEAVCSNFVARMPVSARCNSSYLTYLHSHLYAIRLNVRSIKQTTGIQNLDSSSYLGEPVAFPPLSEQAAIVRFLDHADRRIRRYIRAKQQLITLLEEQKQALIHRTVTGQVDVRTGQPYPAYKPSGVEWLGDVPAHWETWQIGHLGQVGNGSTPSRSNMGYWDGGTYPWLNSSSVNHRRITQADQFVTDLALRECHLPQVQPGSVLVAITGQGKTRGMSAVLDTETTINQHVAYVTPRNDMIGAEYLQLALSAAYRELRAISDDSGSTKGALTCWDISHFRVPLLPSVEQAKIIQVTRQATRTLESASAKAAQEVMLAREYRTRLIADVVTGKLDVLEAAARLPDEVEELEPLDEADALIDGEEEPTDALATAP